MKLKAQQRLKQPRDLLMQRLSPILSLSSMLAILITSSFLPLPVGADENNIIAEGKAITFHRHKGNCLACHAIQGALLPGNIGPPLISMQDRYQNKSQLREQIWDASINNPHTIMPPFGKHKILTEEEIDKVVEFIYTL